MTKYEIAEILNEIGTLLELQGENPFKVRAYRTGARAIEALEEDSLSRLIAENGLESVSGIGEALARKIAELAATGRLEFHEKLKASIEPGLVEMLQLPGLGPKKIQALREKLGVSTIAALAEACASGKVAELPGFGEKTQANILVSIRNREAWGKRHLWWNAREIAEPILEGLRKLPQVRRAEAAGSLRRGLETVGDLDFLASATEVAPVVEWFTTLPTVMTVTAKGETKASVRFESGIQADLRIVPDEQFVFALHHFTGSKDHNVKMRQRALERGLSLSEWGLTPAAPDTKGGQPVRKGRSAAKPSAPSVPSGGPKDEDALFSLLGLHYIPPELREDMGEIEAAEQAELPRLVELSELRGAFHNHTTASDGHNTLAEMAGAAESLGWEFLGIADHSKSSWQAKGLSEERLAAQFAEIASLNASRKFRIHLFSGTECDILPDGRLDFSDTVLRPLDYVVASVHSSLGQEEPVMTARLVRAIENPRTTILGHLSGRLLLHREACRVNVAKVLDAAIANDVIVELNANPYRLDLDWRHWHRASDRGLLCAINPDAHEIAGLAHVRAGVIAARKGWLTPERVVNTWPLDKLKRKLRSRSGNLK